MLVYCLLAIMLPIAITLFIYGVYLAFKRHPVIAMGCVILVIHMPHLLITWSLIELLIDSMFPKKDK